MNQVDTTAVTTGQVRLSFVHLFQAHANKPGQEPKFSTTILIPKSDYATMQRINAAVNAALEKGVTSVWKGARPPQPKLPVWDGDGVRQNGEPFGLKQRGIGYSRPAANNSRPSWTLTSIPSLIRAIYIPEFMPGSISIFTHLTIAAIAA